MNSQTPKPLKPAAKALPVIGPDRCTGCGRCIGACPPRVLWLEADGPNGMGRKRSVLHDAEHCTSCAKCAVICPFDAIEMVGRGAVSSDQT